MNKILAQFVNTTKIAGWTRAIVGAGLAAGIARYPGLKDFIDPATQAEIGIAVSGIAVGAWSHYAKSLAAKKVS